MKDLEISEILVPASYKSLRCHCHAKYALYCGPSPPPVRIGLVRRYMCRMRAIQSDRKMTNATYWDCVHKNLTVFATYISITLYTIYSHFSGLPPPPPVPRPCCSRKMYKIIIIILK